MAEIDIDTSAEVAALEAAHAGEGDASESAGGETIEATADAVAALQRARRGEKDEPKAEEVEAKADEEQGEAEEAEESEQEEKAEEDEAKDEEAEEEEEKVDEEKEQLKAEAERMRGEVEKLSQTRQALVDDIAQGFAREERMEELLYEAAEELEVAKALLKQYGIDEDPRDREIRLLRREQERLKRRDTRAAESEKLTQQARDEARKKVAMARIDGAAQAAGIDVSMFRLKYLHEIQLAGVEKRAPADPESFALSLSKPQSRLRAPAPKTLKPGRGAPVGSFPDSREGDVAFLRAARGG